MRVLTGIGYLFILLTVYLLSGCHDHKSVGPEPVLPEGGTKLYFKNCEPSNDESLWASLTANPDSSCNDNIPLLRGVGVQWQSNWFSASPGTYKEGYHLVFERNTQQASNEDVLGVVFSGIATDFTRRIVLPAGESRTVIEIAETAARDNPADSLVCVKLSIMDSTGYADMDVSAGVGSFIATSASSSSLCELEVNQELTHGLGQPNQGLNFSYLGATGAIQVSFVDFTGGATVLNHLITFGPHYGPCYLIAQSGHCVDTASFYACPPALTHRADTIGSYGIDQLYETDYVKQIVSSGTRVWFWFTQTLSGDTTACRKLSIAYDDNFPFITRNIVTCYDQVSVDYDGLTDHLWIIQRSSGELDSAWGYSMSGIVDTIVTAEVIPQGFLYHGQWLSSHETSALTLSASLTSFTGEAGLPLGEYPLELTKSFGGDAGFSEPNVAGSESWAVNLFNSSGTWTDRYPVLMNANQILRQVTMLSADNEIVYKVNYTTWIDYIPYDSVAVRVLHRH